MWDISIRGLAMLRKPMRSRQEHRIEAVVGDLLRVAYDCPASQDGTLPTAVDADQQKEGKNSRYACDCKLSLAFLALRTAARGDIFESGMLGELLDVLEQLVLGCEFVVASCTLELVLVSLRGYSCSGRSSLCSFLSSFALLRCLRRGCRV